MSEILADMIVRETLRPHTNLAKMTARSMDGLRSAIMHAKRIVFDVPMSRFLADLSNAPFDTNHDRRIEILESLRHGARLPSPVTWIELMGQDFRDRLVEIGGTEGVSDPFGNKLVKEDTPHRWGFLLEQHPIIETAVRVQEWLEFPSIYQRPGFILGVMPYSWVYQTADIPMPWEDIDFKSGMFAHGITNWISPYFGVIYDDEETKKKYAVNIINPSKDDNFTTHKMVVEATGVIRYLMSFLATFNDIPVNREEVQPLKGGYVARGRYRKLLPHTVIKLNLPERTEHRRFARRLIAAARKRAHSVRGHWRVLRGDLESRCAPAMHYWEQGSRAICATCGARRVWVTEHQRGDASLGTVTHEYSVTHNQGTETT